jgi:excisionase family DNA binding protein
VTVADPITLLAELAREVHELRSRVAKLEQREPLPRWMTIDQAASYLDTTPKAIRRRADRGRLPIIRDGRRMYVDRLALDAAFAARSV